MTRENPLRRFRLSALLALTVILYGTAGYMLIEGWDAFDAFYMTIITMSTVGFSEIHPLSPSGRLFTATLIVGGVGTMLYALGVFAEAVAEGRFVAFGRQRRMEQQVRELREHFIVCGYGRIGTQIVQEFERQRIPYVVVEINPEPIARLRRDGRVHVEGDAAAEEILRTAGIERARGLLAAVDSDERVVYITLAARALNPRLFITARAGQPESIRRLELAGANRVVSPYRMAGRLMAELAVRPAVVDVVDTIRHGGSNIGIEEILIGPTSTSVGRGVREAGLLEAGKARLLALRRRDGTLHVNPQADLRLEDGDLVVAMGSEAELRATAVILQ